MPIPEALSFAKHVRPMFTELDIEHMKRGGMDLSDRNDVEKHAGAILAAVSSARMPPPGDGEPRWTSEMCRRLQRWQEQGFQP